MESETKSSKVQPFKTQTGLELMKEAPEVYEGLVDGLLLHTGMSMLCAKPKAGKSTLSRQLAYCVAEGLPFWGRPTMCGDVLYLILEGPKGVVQDHFKQLGLTQERGVIHTVHERMPYKGDLGLQMLEATIKALPNLRLVIVDPIHKLLRLPDSDKYDDVVIAIEKLEWLAKTYNLHVMFLTHGKKFRTADRGDASIGSTGFRGGTDTNIFLEKEDQQRIIATEQRWGVDLEPTLITWDGDRREMSLGKTLEEAKEAKHAYKERETLQRIEGQVIDLITKKTNPTTGELLEDVKGKTTTILAVLEGLERSGRITVEPDGKAKRYRVASIPTEERKAA